MKKKTPYRKIFGYSHLRILKCSQRCNVMHTFFLWCYLTHNFLFICLQIEQTPSAVNVTVAAVYVPLKRSKRRNS